jgi:hypothetical protein
MFGTNRCHQNAHLWTHGLESLTWREDSVVISSLSPPPPGKFTFRIFVIAEFQTQGGTLFLYCHGCSNSAQIHECETGVTGTTFIPNFSTSGPLRQRQSFYPLSGGWASGQAELHRTTHSYNYGFISLLVRTAYLTCGSNPGDNPLI